VDGALQYWTGEFLDLSFASRLTDRPEVVYSCVQCGSCTASCPTANRMAVSPQGLVRLIRLGLKDEVLASQAFWRCTSCMACAHRCPRGIPILDLVIALKAHSMRHGIRVPDDVRLLQQTIATARNVSGDPNEERLVWSRNLPQPLQGMNGVRGADVLYFVGCVASFYPRAFSIPQAFARILRHAGVRFTTLGGEEWCCGYPLYNAGLREDMGELIEHNAARIRALGVRTVVFTCPSCFYAWKVLYPAMGVHTGGLRVAHATELLAELIDDGRVRPGATSRIVTYHDPCDLGRKSGEYDAPRHVLAALPGVELREMPNIRDNGLCCGGGGDVKVYDNDTTVDVARRRVDQALDVRADTIVSSCQQCKRALTMAVNSVRQPVRVLDVAELVWVTLATRAER
jgi:heterodisulfide reductase subunit D